MGAGDRRGGEGGSGSRDESSASHALAAEAHRIGIRLLAIASALFVGALLSSASALALSQRGHDLPSNSSFGVAGTGGGQLEGPSAVAVNEATGDVYVADRANNRIEEWKPAFDAEGTFVSSEFIKAWGWGVLNGKAEFQECTSSCQAGIRGGGKGQLALPVAIAVDNSTSSEPDPSRGDVYVLNKGTHNTSVEKFGPNGEPIDRVETEPERVFYGLAVDSSGKLWLYQSESEGRGEVAGFTNAKNNLHLETGPVETFEASGECDARLGFALGPNDESFYVNHERQQPTEHCFMEEEGEAREATSVVTKVNGAAEAVNPQLDTENTTGIASNLASSDVAEQGDVYVDHGTSVVAYAGDGSLIQRFGSGDLTEGAGLAVDSATDDVYVADSATGKVLVFTPEPSTAPTVDNVSTQNVSTTETEVTAEIDPHGLASAYAVQYSTTPIPTSASLGSCASSPSCAEAPIPPGEIAAGFGSQRRTVALRNLQPGTTYYYRVLAENADGTGESARTAATFTSLPTSAGLLPDGREWELVSPPEKFGGGIVIPSEGGVIEASESGNAITYVANGPIVEHPAGNRSIEPTPVLSTLGFKEWNSEEIETAHVRANGVAGGQGSEYRFFSPDLSLSVVQPYGITPLAEPPLSPPISPAEVQERTVYLRDDAPLKPTPLAPEAGQQEKTLKREQEENYEEAEENGRIEAKLHGEAVFKPGFLPLVTAANDTARKEFGGDLTFVGATPDLTHIVLSSAAPLTSQGSQPANTSSLYEWSAGHLQLVSVLPKNEGETLVPNAHLGDDNSNVRHAISNDGSRIFWEDGGEENLYLRNTKTDTTIRISRPQGVPAEEGGLVRFQTASSDGSKVFFTDTAALTPESENLLPQESNPPADLYEFNVETNKLIDLTVDDRFHESAAVQGVVLGANEEGTILYFVANGVLVPGAQPGKCVNEAEQGPPEAGATCSLYVDEYNEAAKAWSTKLVASLSAHDAPSWEAGGADFADLGTLTSRVSPNGHFLAFMSSAQLTPYINREAKTGQSSAEEPDEEVYLYSDKTGAISCASCDPSGARPVGELDTPTANGGLGLLVDQQSVWEGRRLAGIIPGWVGVGGELEHALYQSRYLSDKGRLFFDSPEALVSLPNETNAGVENVYEYEPEGEGSCNKQSGCVALISSGTSTEESAFLDASVSGDDVFFLTSAQLLPQDRDHSFDVYDAHVCTEASPCLQPPPPATPECGTSVSCNTAPASPTPTYGTPGSATYSGPGNVSGTVPQGSVLPNKITKKATKLTRAQQLAKALKTCRKKASKKKRAACETQARKKYGAKKASKSSKKGKK